MPELVPVLSQDEINAKVAAVAEQITADYRGSELVLIGILKGAFVFLADLIRRIRLDSLKVDFLRAASYGNEDRSSGEIRLTQSLEIDIARKDVLIVEDIVDSGLTLTFLLKYLNSFKPKSVKICAMIDKYERRKADIRVDYACHTVKEGFLIGYGLDYAENYRNLPGIYHLKF